MEQNHGEDLDGNKYINKEEYVGVDGEEYNDKDDNGLDLNLHHRPCYYQDSSTGYVPNPSSQH